MPSSEPDKRATASAYLAAHRVGELFEELGTAALLAKPEDARAFLLEELKRIKTANQRDRVPSRGPRKKAGQSKKEFGQTQDSSYL